MKTKEIIQQRLKMLERRYDKSSRDFNSDWNIDELQIQMEELNWVLK